MPNCGEVSSSDHSEYRPVHVSKLVMFMKLILRHVNNLQVELTERYIVSWKNLPDGYVADMYLIMRVLDPQIDLIFGIIVVSHVQFCRNNCLSR